MSDAGPNTCQSFRLKEMLWEQIRPVHTYQLAHLNGVQHSLRYSTFPCHINHIKFDKYTFHDSILARDVPECIRRLNNNTLQARPFVQLIMEFSKPRLLHIFRAKVRI